MLAVQRPRMDPFDASSSFPFPSPTAPAPGPSLLDDSEAKLLDSFFDGVSSDHFNYDFFSNPPDGSELGLGWDELPPTFMGTTSSFGHQPQMASHPLGDINFADLGTHINGATTIPSSTTTNILGSSTLLGNGSNGAAQNISNNTLFQGSDSTMRPTNGQTRSHSMAQYPTRTNPLAQDRAESRSDWMRVPFYTDMVFGNQPEEAGRERQASLAHARGDILWGSDSNFVPAQAFVPPSHERKQVAALELSHIKAVEEAFYETNKNLETPSSRSSSPSLPNQRTKSGHGDDGSDPRPVKRRKSNFQAELDGDDSPASAKDLRKQKPLKQDRSTSPTSKSNQKRRKSGTGNATTKPARENLTEEQKRENHIKSEQKRRTLIREGFEDLNNLVPGLRGGGFSKSAVLIMSADWLEGLLRGNEVLRQRLEALQNR